MSDASWMQALRKEPLIEKAEAAAEQLNGKRFKRLPIKRLRPCKREPEKHRKRLTGFGKERATKVRRMAWYFR
jgi:hypothetical protein